MTVTHPVRMFLFAVILAVASHADSRAQEEGIRWRVDYNSARKEARQFAKPLFLDFGTEQCYHCRRLEASTFQDPTVIELLNKNFVPLKIDGNATPSLVEALRI